MGVFRHMLTLAEDSLLGPSGSGFEPFQVSKDSFI